MLYVKNVQSFPWIPFRGHWLTQVMLKIMTIVCGCMCISLFYSCSSKAVKDGLHNEGAFMPLTYLHFINDVSYRDLVGVLLCCILERWFDLMWQITGFWWTLLRRQWHWSRPHGRCCLCTVHCCVWQLAVASRRVHQVYWLHGQCSICDASEFWRVNSAFKWMMLAVSVANFCCVVEAGLNRFIGVINYQYINYSLFMSTFCSTEVLCPQNLFLRKL